MMPLEYPLVRLSSEAIEINDARLFPVNDITLIKNRIEVKNFGPFKGHAFHLTSEYDWMLGRDSLGLIVLIPLVK